MMPDNNEASESANDEIVDDASSEPATANGHAKEAASGQNGVGEQAPVSDLDAAAQEQEPFDLDGQPLSEEGLGATGGSSDEVEELKAALHEAQERAQENWDRLVRLQAEMENQRKRAQNDVTKARKFALEGIVGDLLPVKDSLEMGLAAAGAEDADPGSLVTGAELTLKMLAQVFEKNNIIEVNPVDEKFDPEFHQAMSMQEIEGREPNTVTSVMQKGYTLNERLVRPALVMVSK